MSGWGSLGWGLASWGLGLPSAFLHLASAEVRATRIVRVTTTVPALSLSTTGVGDALNPRAWTVAALDSAGNVVRTLIVLAVAKVDSTVFDVLTLEKFDGYGITHRVSAPFLRDTSSALITAPYSADFRGTAEFVVLPTTEAQQDLRSDPFSIDGSIGGALVVGSDGDYATHSGADLTIKLILRRMASQPNSWFQYSPEYGLGLRLQEPFTAADLVRLQGEAEQQVLSDPDIDTATVRATASGAIVSLSITARLKRTGVVISTSVSGELGAVSF